MLSHKAQLIQAENVMSAMALDEKSVFLHAMPLFHVAGAASAHATTRAGGTHAFMPAFDPAAIFAWIREEAVDTLALAPTMFAALLDSPARDDAALPGVRSICRAPHVWLSPGKSTLDLFGRDFTLLDLDKLGNEEARALYERRFVLVRPDGHVAWRGDAAPGEAIQKRVRGW